MCSKICDICKGQVWVSLNQIRLTEIQSVGSTGAVGHIQTFTPVWHAPVFVCILVSIQCHILPLVFRILMKLFTTLSVNACYEYVITAVSLNIHTYYTCVIKYVCNTTVVWE